MNEAIQRAIRSDIAIYSIGINDPYFGEANKDALRKTSERTGGRAFFPKTGQDFEEAFAEIQQELRSQYIVGYQSANPGQAGPFHKVRIEIINPQLRKQHMQIAHRQGYFTS
jgi:Ca-activated chloride channel family protein